MLSRKQNVLQCFRNALPKLFFDILWEDLPYSQGASLVLVAAKITEITEITKITKIWKTEWSGDYKNRMKWWLQKQNEMVITKTEWSGDYKNRMKWWLQKQNDSQCSAVGYIKISSRIEYHKIDIYCIISYIALCKIISYNTTYHIVSYHVISYNIITQHIIWYDMK